MKDFMLEDKYIKAFLTVVEEGGFSAAARRLGLTQPAVSTQISALEKELGIRLFERGRELLLTSEGEAFLPYARRIADAYALVNSLYK